MISSAEEYERAIDSDPFPWYKYPQAPEREKLLSYNSINGGTYMEMEQASARYGPQPFPARFNTRFPPPGLRRNPYGYGTGAIMFPPGLGEPVSADPDPGNPYSGPPGLVSPVSPIPRTTIFGMTGVGYLGSGNSDQGVAGLGHPSYYSHSLSDGIWTPRRASRSTSGYTITPRTSVPSPFSHLAPQAASTMRLVQAEATADYKDDQDGNDDPDWKSINESMERLRIVMQSALDTRDSASELESIPELATQTFGGPERARLLDELYRGTEQWSMRLEDFRRPVLVVGGADSPTLSVKSLDAMDHDSESESGVSSPVMLTRYARSC